MKIGINLLLWTEHVREEHFGLFQALKAVGIDVPTKMSASSRSSSAPASPRRQTM